MTNTPITCTDVGNELKRARSEQYHHFPGTNVTVCCIELANGFCITGESAPIGIEIFDAERGKEVAYCAASEKLWELLDYRLKERIYQHIGANDERTLR